MKTKGVVDFRNKAVVVTGAASGIGRAIALDFARRGARLAVADIDEERLHMVQCELESLGANARTHMVDVARAEEMQAFCEDVFRDTGRVDVLCNIAGVAVGGDFQDIPLEDWEWIMGINLWGVVHGCHFFYPRMIEQRSGGHIINMASAAGLIPLLKSTPYSCTKYAVVGFSETLRAEAARHGIGVSVVCPGFVASDIYRAARQNTPRTDIAHEEEVEQMEKLLSKLRRTPDKVAGAVVEAVEKNKGLVVIFSEARLGDIVYRLNRRALESIMARAASAGDSGYKGKPACR